jgi:hypothetical protein
MIQWIEVIKRCFDRGAVYFTLHARREMELEEFGLILTSELIEAAGSLEVVEEYREDVPYPSALILGFTTRKRPLHMVCAYDAVEDSLTVVTV